jgi:sporulation protein YlmC with PRC-barrel domain
MKYKLNIFTCASAASLLTFAALADETINQNMEENGASHQRMTQAHAGQLNGAAKASDLIGLTVKNYQNEKLGKVQELAVDVGSGRIVQVIISTGGFLGMGNTLTAVPPSALHHNVANKVLHLDVTKETLAAAPRFDTAKWAEGTQSNRVVEFYGYYREQPYFVDNREDGYVTNNLNLIRAGTLPRNMDGTINTSGSRGVERFHDVEVARNIEETSNTISTRNSDGTWTRQWFANGRVASGLGYVLKSSQLIGMPVQNRQNEKIGKVENFTVDFPAGRIVAVIISTGGFIGMGDELSAVPPTALQLNAERDSLQLDATKESLVSAAHFQSNQWPDLGQPGYASGVYRAYQVDPYFDTEADNTRINVRDRDSRTLTPLDQGNSQSDLQTTAQIRKVIIANKTMSVNAHNVKIITQNGRVTLRGPVNTAQEKRSINEIANRIAHSGNVDDQLEMKPTPVRD